MITITKEQAKQIIEAADEVITALAGTNEDVHPDNSTKMVQLYDDLNDHYAPPEVVRELARIALASLEAEAVAFRSKLKPPSAIGSERWDYTDHRQPDGFELENCVIERLFTAPPAPVSVPDEITFEKIAEITASQGYEYSINECISAASWWNACRAAMLQGADGNSLVIPDGWVMVPIEPTTNQWAAGMQAFDSGMDKVTRVYKAMLTAAPQQEVK